MKKSFKIISALILSSTMAFGLGATIFATTSKQTRQVQAAEGNYYSSINSNETGSTLLNSLHTLVNSGSVSVSYNWSRYEAADEDPNNSNNIITIYARSSLAKTAHVSNNVGWNREHTFPQSKMSSSQAESDNHIIFASDYKINGARSNIKMGVVTSGSTLTDSYGNSTTCRKANSLFDPNNLSRGIVARSTMYAAAMYEYDPTDNFESIATMLNWHLTYQPTSQEINRNDVVYSNQHNRNPFIDHPEYACKIWGNTNDTTRSICGMSSTGVTSISKTSTSIVVGGTDTISAVSSNNGTITWSSSDTDVATVSPTSTASGSSTTITAVAAGTATITASVTISGQTYSKQCSVNVTTSGGGGGQNTGDYTLVTSVSTLSTSDKVVITTENRDSGVTGWNGNKDATVSDSESEWMQYAVSKSGNNVYFKDTSTNTFIAATSSNEFKYTSDGSACTADEFGHFLCGGRYLCKNTSFYRLYSSIGGYEPFFIYKVNTTTQKTLSSISVDTAPTKTTYTAGEHFDPTGLKLKLTYSDNSNSYVTYSTSNSSDFTFSPTTSTSLTTSHTSVTISYGGKSTTQAITVNASTTPTVTSVTVSPATLTLDLNGTKTGNLSATVTGTNSPAQTVTWSSSDSNVATVSSSGTVTAKTVGNATITATSTVDGTKNGTCEVTVKDTSVATNSEIIDLNSQGYSNQDVVESASGTNATVTFNKGTGSNDPKYYTTGTAVRVYGGNYFTVSSSLTIIKIELTFSDGEGTNTISTDKVTFSDGTWQGSANSVTFTIGGTSGHRRIASIKVTYQGGTSTKTLSSITVTNAKTSYVVNDTFVKPTVTANYSDSSTANVSNYASYTGYDLSTAGNYTVTVSYSEGNVTKSATYGITVVASALGTSPYENGVAYKMYFESTNTTPSVNYYFTGDLDGYYGTTSSTAEDGVDVYFEANGNGQNIYFEVSGVKYYFYVAVSGTHYNFKFDLNEAPEIAWVYDQANGCMAYPISSVNYTFGNYGNRTLFAAYSLTAYPNNYKVQFEASLQTNPALEYAQTFLAAFTCDSTGANAPTFTTSWASLKTTFNNLAGPHQTTLRTATANASGTTIEQAMARYDYVVAKYEYEDFIGRLSGNSANRMNSFSGDSANNLLLVLGSISLLGGLTYLAYFLKKRKED